MPWQPKKPKAAGRTVRHKMADGTVKEYRYESYKASPGTRAADSLSALIEAYRRSPEWHALAERSRIVYALYLRPLDKVGHTPAASVKRGDILALRDGIAAGRGQGAANGFHRAAAALFTWAVDREWMEHTPVARIKPLPGGHLRAWTPDEAARAIAKLKEHFRRVVILALYTGQRRGDLCAMGWSAYDGRTIRLVQQKTGAPLVLPVHPALKAEMDAWKAGATATTILTNAKGLPWKPQVLSQTLPVQLRRIGLSEDLNVHGLRKLAAANLADAGCSTHEIAAITGHKSLAMLQLYTATADQERLAGAAILRLQTPYKIQP